MPTHEHPAVAFEAHHDHTHCVSSAMAKAQAICKEKGLRLTAIRELVLKLIWTSHKPMVAYDLLPELAKAGFNSAPPTVYRALDFLQEHGLVHRIARLNAYIGCQHPHNHQHVFFLICNQCGHVQEADPTVPADLLTDYAAGLGFKKAQEQTIEVLGTCPSCLASAT